MISIIAEKMLKTFETILHYSLNNPLITANQNLLQKTRK